MDSGRCRKCGRAFTAGEITGTGVLRARPAHQGGPTIEFACPACHTITPLVPYGNGRYALPGQPPPPPPTDVEREMPWKQRDAAGDRQPQKVEPSATRQAAPPPPPKAKPPPESAAERPLTTLEAFALLGLSPAAAMADVEKAYRERALLCHPDKVAHLDADFAELANRKFRRLQTARDLLVLVVDRHGRSAR